MKLSVVGLVAALLFLAAPAQSQVVQVQLDSATVLMASQGFAPIGFPANGSLDDGENATLELHLNEGSYMIVGVCDQDCTDLDLVLTQQTGREVAADREMDDVPMLIAEIGTAGRHVLSVNMAGCSVEPCGWGVRLFERR